MTTLPIPAQFLAIMERHIPAHLVVPDGQVHIPINLLATMLREAHSAGYDSGSRELRDLRQRDRESMGDHDTSAVPFDHR